MGKWINKFQEIGGGDPSSYGHAAICTYQPGIIAESTWRINEYPITKYLNQSVCLFVHKQMDVMSFMDGYQGECQDNLGQFYPFHRLLFHAADNFWRWTLRTVTRGHYEAKLRATSMLFLDWPVCSEYVGQFMRGTCLETGIDALDNGGLTTGINPDDWDDVRAQRPDLYRTKNQGVLMK